MFITKVSYSVWARLVGKKQLLSRRTIKERIERCILQAEIDRIDSILLDK